MTATIPRATVDTATEKPLLRGVSHQWGALVFAVLGVALVIAAAPDARIGTAIYVLCLVAMLTTSAVYHRVPWGEVGSARMRKADHTGIFLAIAGTYTPICVSGLDGSLRWVILGLVWTLAAIGILLEWLPFRPPKGYVTAVYVTLGWVAVIGVPALWDGLGLVGVLLLAAGGLLYTVGAFVHAFRWPDPWPRVFGFHEIWHLFVLAAAAMHFACVALVVLP
jgi:hemolysin III